MRKLIAFDDDTLDKLTQLARDRMGTFQELADEAFADLLKKHGIPDRSQGCAAEKCRTLEGRGAEEIENRKGASMNSDPDPFEQGERAARQNIPAEANPYQDGSEQHALWAAGHEKVAGAREANESEGT